MQLTLIKSNLLNVLECIGRLFISPRRIWTIGLLLGVLYCPNAVANTRQTASWYDSKSCQKEAKQYNLKGSYWGKKTASGQVFDENALTCALPHKNFGGKYRVTNIKNGRSVIVIHTDLGPSTKLVKKGRIIDLSKGAFQRLARLEEGVIPIKIESIK